MSVINWLKASFQERDNKNALSCKDIADLRAFLRRLPRDPDEEGSFQSV